MTHQQHKQLTLADLPLRQRAEIVGICECSLEASLRLREIGFCEGDNVEVLNYGPWGRSPLNVRLHNTFVAIRPIEAGRIFVNPLSEKDK